VCRHTDVTRVPLPCVPFSCFSFARLSPPPTVEPSLLAQYASSWLDEAETSPGRVIGKEVHIETKPVRRLGGTTMSDVPRPTQERPRSALPGGTKRHTGSATIPVGRQGLALRFFVGLAVQTGPLGLRHCTFCCCLVLYLLDVRSNVNVLLLPIALPFSLLSSSHPWPPIIIRDRICSSNQDPIGMKYSIVYSNFLNL
jgi:hypothetical protein